ncbi:immunoglobulin-like domain-containing protein [Paenibacillus sp.]|uniref:immunoglobulin-like domain-containing protein n=1 Tax=Paenibacillus sp. TaxID=58172 RepID=UPI002D70BA59|nr:immunoglobulin-like domain-containing protein [Paenibacillus sp.]HZG85975.1 immunoglobulin-like domain-containing protein [Paenibacillus sp.]
MIAKSVLAKAVLSVVLAASGALPYAGLRASASELPAFEAAVVTEDVYGGPAPSEETGEFSSPPLFQDDFQDGDLNGWTINRPGLLSVVDDASSPGNKMLYVNGGDEAFASVNADIGADYVYEAKIRKLESGAYPGILVRYTPGTTRYYNFQFDGNTVKLNKGTGGTLGQYSLPVTTGQWYALRVTAEGSSLKAYIDGKLVIEATDASFPTGTAGFRSRWAKSALDDVDIRRIPAAKPAAPSGLQAAAVTATTATLTWEDPAAASADSDAMYRLYRSTSPDANYAQVYAGTLALFKDTGLSSTTAYYYRVTAERHKYESIPSASVEVVTAARPAAPTGLAVTSKSSNSLSLEWDAASGADAYKLYRSTSLNGAYAVVYTGSDNVATDAGLASGVRYFYKVSSVFGDDESALSEAVDETTTLVLPDSPDELPGIVAAYKFDEGSGTTASPTAASSNQTKAALANGAAWTAGRTGGAVNLDGTNDHIVLPRGLLNGLDDFTIAAWVKQDTLKTWARIFDIGNDTNSYIFLSPKSSQGETRYVFKNNGSEQIVSVLPAMEKAGGWMHYAVTLSGSTAILYVNGEEAARNEQVSIRPRDLGNTTQNYIGRSLWPDPYLDGQIDDFYVFNRALGPAEVAMFTEPENAANVAADKEALTLGDTSAVMNDIALPTRGANGSSIVWSSDRPDVVSTTGLVTRPAVGEPDAEVTLTATLRQGNAEDAKTFRLTVLAELADEDAVAADLAALSIPNANAVTAKLSLPSAGANRTRITWASADELHLRPDGMVSRPPIGAGDLNVTLTATVARGDVSGTREFPITILEQDDYTAYLFAYYKKVNGTDTLHYAVSRNGRTWTELGSDPAVVVPREGGSVFKLNSEEKWYKYEYANGTWTLYSSASESGPWARDAESFALPAGALHGGFSRIDEAEWSRLVHALSTPRTLNVVQWSTKTGVPPRLPAFVKVDYTNNLYTNMDVAWDAVDPAAYAEVGTFTAAGTLAGTSTRVEAAVQVIDGSAYGDAIRNGEFWYDTDGAMIQAHGGHIMKVGGTYYWFGENKGHNSAVLNGVSVYASQDLKTWEYRNDVITTKSHPELAHAKIERPKVLYNEKIGKYVLWGHWEEAGNYNQANVVVAVSDTVDGDYQYLYRFRPNGMASRDFTVFQDDDGTAYLFGSTNNNYDMNVYRLTDDYLYVDEYLYTAFVGQHREAPAIAKKDGLYYLVTSGASGWYPNQGKYATTADLTDPFGWSELKLLGNPSTYYTQPAFIFKVQGSEADAYIYVGDRWNPTALRTSQYIWLPLHLGGGTASMEYAAEWDLDVAAGTYETAVDVLVSQGKPVAASTQAGASLANDGDEYNYYDWNTTSFPVTWRVDLERETELSRIDISWREWNGSEVYYTYKLEASNDDVHYDLLIDQSGNRTTSFNSHKLSGTYRYVKLTVLGEYGHTNNADRPVTWYRGLHEVKVFAYPEDDAAPVTTASLSSDRPESGGWHASSATLALSAADEGRGVKRTEYRVNGGDWIPYEAPVAFSEEGVATVEYRSEDHAGNVEEAKSVTIRIDKSAPVAALAVDRPQIGPPNHQMVPIRVDVDAHDAISGVARVELVSITSSEPDDGLGDGRTEADIQDAEFGAYDTEFSLRAERSGTGAGRVYTITYAVTDAAGHTTTATIEVNVSKP